MAIPFLKGIDVSGDVTITGDVKIGASGTTRFGKLHFGVNGTMGQTTAWSPDNNNVGLWIESDSVESGGVFMNGNTFALWSPGDNDVFKVYDEDTLPTGDAKFVIKGDGLTIGAAGYSTDGLARLYVWRAVDNTTSNSTNYVKIARLTGTASGSDYYSDRCIIELAGRSTSYSNNALPAMGYIVAQLQSDANWDVVYYNHHNGSDEVVDEVGVVQISNTQADIYVRVGSYAEVTASGHISDGTITVDSTRSSTAPTGYTAANAEYKVWNSGNDGAGSLLDADKLDAQEGSYYLNYNNFTNTPTIPSAYTHPTHPGDDINIDTGALTGATVISDLDFNITTDTLGHVTDANATIATRTLTASDIGAAASSHNHNDLYYTESESDTRYFRRNAANDVDVRIAPSHGRGVRFWDSDSYKIYMSSVATGGSIGGSVAGSATSDYNMYFKMTGGTNRGFVFKNSGTNITQIDSNGHITTSGHYYGKYVNGAFSNIYRMGGIYFTWDSDSYGTNFNHSITSTDNGTYSDDITINSYGHIRINIDSNNNGTNVFQVGSHSTGTGGSAWFTIKDAGGITMNDNSNTVNGTYALAVNQNTTASSLDAFACGENTTASGRQAFAGGYNTTASGAGSFAIGGNSVASGANSLCAGGDGTATNSAATSIGTLNDATGGHSFAAGYNSTASGLVSFAMGSGATASGPKATAFGEGNGAGGELDFVIGAYNTSTSNLAYGNFISGYDNNVHSSGGGSSSLNIVGGTLNEIGTTSLSFSSGDLNLVLGAENNIGFWQPPGVSTLTSSAADRNIVQGQQNNVLGTDGIVVGRYCMAGKGIMQSAIGFGLVTPLGSTTGQVPNINDGNPQFIVGRHNAFDASAAYMHLFAVGNGASDSSRFNSFNVLSSTTGTARVGIGRNQPVYVLDVAGQARLSGGYTTSDERLKENIQDNTLGLSELKQLRTVSFDWKSGEILGQSFEDIDANKNCRGLIAQEAEAVSSDLVETDTSEHAIKSINQGAITAMLIKAVQEQQDIIESLKERIETLENN